MTFELRWYQREAVARTMHYFERGSRGNPLIVLPTGAGKSIVIAAFVSEVLSRWPGERFLMLTHVKELVDQNARKLEALLPFGSVGVYCAGLSRKELGAPVTAASIQSAARPIADGDIDADLVLIDECFVGNTGISTPDGRVPISELKPGDVVLNAVGHGRVENVSRRAVRELVAVEMSDGTRFECTENHPIFTSEGWRSAGALEVGSRLLSQEELSSLWGRVSTVVEGGARRERAAMDASEVLLDLLLQEACEPDDGPRYSKEDDRDASSGRAPTQSARRERDPSSDTARSAVEGNGARMGGGGCRAHWYRQGERISNLLQGGYWASRNDGGNRSGWVQSLLTGEAGAGSEEGRASEIARVVRVSRVECGSPVAVFNLQVSGHPSYFAEGKLVHNCHLVPKSGEGQYRSAIEALRARNTHLRVIGLSATPYRTDTGLLTQGEGRIFTDVVIDVPIPRLIKEGYLSPLRSKGSRVEAELEGVTVRAGDYAPGELEAAMLEGDLVARACDDILRHAADRSRWLVFASGVKHALAVAEELDARGVSVACVFGETPTDERDATIAAFKRGELRALVNVGVLTTGFDAPETDCVVLLRPTKSPGLYYQMVGRGFRIAPTKPDCLVLDFGGNVRLHGPVDQIRVERGRGGPKKPQAAPVKTCPECDEIVPLGVRACPACTYEWPASERAHETRAGDEKILGDDEPSEWADVVRVSVAEHVSRSSGKTTLRVDYACGLRTYSEYVCLEHDGFARKKAEQWWRSVVAPGAVPRSVSGAAEWLVLHPLAVTRIEVKREGRYDRVVGRQLAEPREVMTYDTSFDEADDASAFVDAF